MRPVSSETVLRGLTDVPLLVTIPPLPTTEVRRAVRRGKAANFGFSTISVGALLAVVIFITQT